VLCGSSAGGHLAALYLSKLPDVREACNGSGAHIGIRGFVGVSGVYNVARLAAANPSARTKIVEPVFGTDPASWAQVWCASSEFVLHMRRFSDLGCPQWCPLSYAGSSCMSQIPMLLLNAEKDFHLQQVSNKCSRTAAVHVSGKLFHGAGFHRVCAVVQDADEYAAQLLAARKAIGSQSPVAQATVAAANHFTIVGSIGQPGDKTTQLITSFVHDVTK
jgi:pimeloyl-ACP methyl ester carboxylesterase